MRIAWLRRLLLAEPGWDDIPYLIKKGLSASGHYEAIPELTQETLRPGVISSKPETIVWRIPVKGSLQAFMTAERSEHIVVFVDARKFFAIWRATRKVRKEGYPSALDKLHKDYKYWGQDSLWAESARNPRELAEISFSSKTGIGFTNGVTRTYWLLNNGAASFPISLSNRDEAQSLHELAGDPVTQPCRLNDLIPEATSDEWIAYRQALFDEQQKAAR